MNYKKKYENALNAARKFKNDCPSLWDTESNPFRGVFEELEETEDEKIRKALISVLKSDFEKDTTIYGISVGDIIAWLEKQKPTDKIEPKFKVGDWIINGHGFIMHIDGIDGNMYIYHLLDDNGKSLKYDIDKTEKSCHLWTIQDAKDGDILVSEYGNPFIFNGIVNKPTMGAYCGITTKDSFVIAPLFNDTWVSLNVLPAIKEQRDFLFKKMHDAGYEWNAEKKKLESF